MSPATLVDEAFEKAREVLRWCTTERGFTACSVEHDTDPRSNYRSVWARDSAMTGLWAAALGDGDLEACARRSLETILDNRSPEGVLPNYVNLDSGEAETAGIGNIAGIDSALWTVIAACRLARRTGDLDFLRSRRDELQQTMDWLLAHDSNGCGLLEVPEASDWTDLFGRSHNVLYDEVLWYRAGADWADALDSLGEDGAPTRARADRARERINTLFWPNTDQAGRFRGETFAQRQFAMGSTSYLVAQLTPFDFDWRCDVFANVLATLHGVLDHDRAVQVMRFCRGVGADRPHPVRVLYPAIRPGEKGWRDYFTVHLHNVPHHYHNGGIWPFVGGLWVRFLLRLGEREAAEAALSSLAELCAKGMEGPWEFTEWAHGETGEPMGKRYQAWSAAGYAAAYLRFQGEARLEEDEGDGD